MKIAIGSDHRGYDAKERVKLLLESLDQEVVDHGAHSRDSIDYPDLGWSVAQEVAAGRVDRGILVCGSGIGMSITANKVPGIRAALCHDEWTAQMSRRHNDANVLCLPGDLIGDALMQTMVKAWIETEFEGGRHGRRIEKIRQFEQAQLNGQGCAASGTPAATQASKTESPSR